MGLGSTGSRPRGNLAKILRSSRPSCATVRDRPPSGGAGVNSSTWRRVDVATDRLVVMFPCRLVTAWHRETCRQIDRAFPAKVQVTAAVAKSMRLLVVLSTNLLVDRPEGVTSSGYSNDEIENGADEGVKKGEPCQ